MPGARDTELLNFMRSYDQTPPAPPQCQFNHWGLTVYLPPELAKQFEPPADSVAFAEFMEQMLPHCRVFMSVYTGTRAEDPHKVFPAFIDHFMTPSPANPIPNFRRYGHKGHGQPYPIWFLKCFSSSSPPKGDKVVPFHSDRPHAVPKRPRKERPQPTRENPFQQTGEEGDVANFQPYSDEIKFYPG